MTEPRAKHSVTSEDACSVGHQNQSQARKRGVFEDWFKCREESEASELGRSNSQFLGKGKCYMGDKSTGGTLGMAETEGDLEA